MNFKILLYFKTSLILLIYSEGYHARGYKPRINPDVHELIMNEGEKLVITCTSNGTIRVHYPKTDLEARIFTSDFETKFNLQKDGLLQSKSIRKKTIYGDSGWYGCYDVSVKLPKDKNYDDPNASWLYVYVQSTKNAFVSSETQAIFGVVGKSAVIPCRTTSPELIATLKKAGKEVEGVHFEPKEGFKLEDLSISDGGAYSCSVNQGDYNETVDYMLYVYNKYFIKDLYISDKGLEFVTMGSSLRVKCSLKIDLDHPPFDFVWETPRKSKTSRILKPVAEYTQGYKLVTSEYVEDRLHFVDEGVYTCHVRYGREKMTVSKYIKIHDPNISFINLTYESASQYSVSEGQSVTFSASFIGNPTPSLTWEGPGRKSINAWENKNYAIEYEKSTSSLKINNVSMKDAGTYALVALNDVQKERLNFTLKVFGKPLVRIDNHSGLNYTFDENKKFTCNIVSNPRPSVRWSYTKCSKHECKNVELNHYEVYVVSETLTVTEVETHLDASGSISCSACNNFGCDTDKKSIVIPAD